MRRRTVLASGTALLAALAGCAHPDTVLDMEAATASDIVDEVTVTVSPDSDDAALVSEAVDDGSATANDTSPALDPEEPILFEGRVYDVSVTEGGSREATRHEIAIDYNPGEVTPEHGEIAYEDLPEADRDALGELVPPRERRPEGDGFDMGVHYTYDETEAERSVLVPDQRYDVVTYEGERFRIQVTTQRVEETEYRYEVTEVADVETYADRVREQYLFPLSGLSEAEREVVEEAIDSNHFGDSDAFRSVVDRLQEHPGLNVHDFDGTWLAEYEGVEYITYARW